MLSALRFNRARHAVLGTAIAAVLVAGPAFAAPGAQDGHAAHAHQQSQQQATPPASAHDHHGHDTAAAPVPPAGQRWATDAPLRDGMGRIRQAVNALEHYQHGHLDQTQAVNATRLIDNAVQDMIANCKLAPDADAALHVLIAKFVTGADAVRSGRDVSTSIKSMQDALAKYPAQFDDPTWDVNPED